ncbi:MAG: LLM class F420-dependent oxidoreductase [Candidatus Binatia bacterium]|nr:MAG: LLM class F420-dependent oxidoreductase [Candidatus Binatia bacterium]
MNLGKLGISLPVPPDVQTCVWWAQRAEDLGYESVWIADTNGPDPFALAAAVCQATKTLRVGIAVTPVYTRTPGVLAQAAATIAQLAPGRFILGVGSSSHTIVEQWHGLAFAKPVSRVRETVQLVRSLLRGEKSAFEGRTVRSRGLRLLMLPAAPVPIYVGALRPPMLELAGEVADGVAVNLFPASALPRMLEHVAQGAQRAGRDPNNIEVVCRHQVMVTSDRAAARELFRSALTGYFATPVYNQFAAWYGFEEEARLIAEGFRKGDRALTRKGMSDRFVDALAIFGSLEECRERIAEYVAAGVHTTAISVLSFDPDVVRATLEGLAPARA